MRRPLKGDVALDGFKRLASKAVEEVHFNYCENFSVLEYHQIRLLFTAKVKFFVRLPYVNASLFQAVGDHFLKNRSGAILPGVSIHSDFNAKNIILEIFNCREKFGRT